MSAKIAEISGALLSLLSNERVYSVLLGVILAGLIAFGNNFLQSRRDRKSRTVENVAHEFLNLLDELDRMVKELWSSSRAELSRQREMVLSLSITATQRHITECLNLMFNLKKSRSYQREELQKIIDEIILHSTSRLFGQAGREASREVILLSGNEVLKLRIRFQKFIYQ